LESLDLGRRLAGVHTRLVKADARLTAATMRVRNRAEAQLRSCAGRLEVLNPLAVLARGYAVCWDGHRTRIIRSAANVNVGEEVRVTLADGELECEVRATTEPLSSTPDTKSG